MNLLSLPPLLPSSSQSGLTALEVAGTGGEVDEHYYEDPEVARPSKRDVDGVCEVLREHIREMTTATEHYPPVSVLPHIRL